MPHDGKLFFADFFFSLFFAVAELVATAKQATDLVSSVASAAAPDDAPRSRVVAALLLAVDVVVSLLLPVVDVLTDAVTLGVLVGTLNTACFASEGVLSLGREDNDRLVVAFALSGLAAGAGAVGLLWLGVAAYKRWPRTFSDTFANKLRGCLKRLSEDASTAKLCTAEGWWTSLHALQAFLFLLEDVPTIVSAFIVAGVLPLPPIQFASVAVSLVVLCKTVATFASLMCSPLTACCCRKRSARFFLRCRVAACLVIFLLLAAVLFGALMFSLLATSAAAFSDGGSEFAVPQLRSREFENSVGVRLVQSGVGFVGAEPFASSAVTNVWMTKNSARLASQVAFQWLLNSTVLPTHSKEMFDGDLTWPFTKLLSRLSTASHVVLVPDITGGPVLLALFVSACAAAHPNETFCANCSAQLPPGHVVLSRSFAATMGEFFLPDCAFDPRAAPPCNSTLLLNFDNADGVRAFCSRECAASVPTCQTLAAINETAPLIAWTRTFDKPVLAADCF